MSQQSGGMTYKDAGVNYADMDPFKRRAQLAARETDDEIRRFGFSVVPWTRGESVFLIETPLGYLGFVVEGLGTKSLVADALRLASDVELVNAGTFYGNVAQCNVAMAVNDLVTLGISPLVYGQYIAVGDSDWFKDEKRCRDLIDGTKRACTMARCVWGGGETPTLKGIIDPKVVDLAGATMGILRHKDRLIDPARITHGDAIIIVESSGIHANGLTLARGIAKKLSPDPARPELGYLTKLSDGRTYGETLLDPTHIYVGLIEDCLSAMIDIHYAVNITGHGWCKLMRALQPWSYVVDILPTQLPIFDFIQKHGPVTDEEAYGNLNMSAGFAVYLPESQASHVTHIAKGLGLRAFVAGHIEAGEKKVVIKPKGLVYAAETLAVR